MRTFGAGRVVAVGAAVACAVGTFAGASAQAATFPGSSGVMTYTRFVASTPGSQIWTVNAKTEATVDISRHHYGDDEPSYSPDGTTIAFVNNGSIYTMTAHGADRTNLTPGSHGSYADPAWSPNGTQLVYGFNGGIGVMNSDGAHKRTLTEGSDDFDPDWSPDGTLIAFTSYRDNEETRIFVMNTDGSDIRDLSSVTDPDFMYNENAPSWAPDSQHLFIVSSRSTDGYQAFEMARDGSTVVQVTDAPSAAGSPVFSPNGKSIAFTGAEDGKTEVFLQQPINHAEIVITSTPENSITGGISWQAKAPKTS
jgi:Tol biopolymer transport system component